MSKVDEQYAMVFKQMKRWLRYWIRCRQNTIWKLRLLAKKSVSEHCDANVINIMGKSTTLVGTGISIAGFTASFFTFGTSLILSAVGLGIGAFGAVTSASSNLALNFMSKTTKQDVNRILQVDYNALQKVLYWTNYWKRFRKSNDADITNLRIENVQATNQPHALDFLSAAAGNNTNNIQHNELECSISTVKNIGIIGKGCAYDLAYCQVGIAKSLTKQAARVFANYSDDIANVAGKAAGNAVDDAATTAFASLGIKSRIFSIGGNVVSMVLLPMDIYSLVKSAFAVSSGTCKLSELLRKTAKNLEDEMPHERDVVNIVHQILQQS